MTCQYVLGVVNSLFCCLMIRLLSIAQWHASHSVRCISWLKPARLVTSLCLGFNVKTLIMRSVAFSTFEGQTGSDMIILVKVVSIKRSLCFYLNDFINVWGRNR